MQTQPSIKKVKEKKLESLVTKEQLLIGFALFMIVFVFGLIFVTFRLIINMVSPTATPTQFLAPTSTSTVGTSLPEIFETGSTVPDTPTIETATIDIITMPGTITPTQIMTVTQTATTSVVNGFCVYEVKEDDSLGLGGVLEKFGQRYESTNQYFYFESCEIDPPSCTLKIELSQHNHIDIGYWLLIEFVNQEECETSSDGNWITQTE